MNRMEFLLPLAVRTTTGLARLSVSALRALVLVTALTPLVGVLMASVAVREACERARKAR